MLFDRFKKKATTSVPYERLVVDLHSHLLPGIDDGVQTMEESLDLIRRVQQLGIKKIITTPHIYWGNYNNTAEIIRAKTTEVQHAIKVNQINIQFEATAEYFINEHFVELLQKKELLTFGKNYILIETSHFQQPYNFQTILFDIVQAGYNPY